MSTTRDALKNLPRPVRAVTLPGGGVVHVRDITLAEVFASEARAADEAAGSDRSIREGLLQGCYALAEPDGTPAFPDASEADLELVARLTPSQLRAVIDAAIPSTDAAKNG